ncbi:Geranylgeranyl transferase type-1 subunit beta [Lasiodiplodia hormozganensis]|uniref:Geranylgeranyl transferase type-1 subunit beta n=2 Tax=Lasiodiplodia TaxID=66739 RepID=A0A5N5D4C6_9PEZI|nr:Geranylgeranyl transferase type I beta subunit [Lasiodiplodia theobromae]KAB2572272.1 Geranylgeranyl transferase type-1 subunit beta [Lasiodiplodia theobromae]KAF4536733.1 Geranylgeranyl transferase type I beta subunit [Lasiodiplodia theobromae]KAK0642283.1 Geranylgeranyl transferase type-1 subunit beta [Lasiodiplodia hormozganensis]
MSAAQLSTPRQLTYWKRCLKTYLPHLYTSNDCNRMTLAFFIVAALDLLGAVRESCTEQERQDYIAWVYRNQHPDGGFRAAPAMDLAGARSADNGHWDPANLPATYFALQTLLVLGDDLQRVKRRECLQWLPRLQRPDDGSFGETLGEGGRIEGGHDTRFIYCAAGVRWILRGCVDGDVDGVRDIDVDAVVRCIRASETYDGGISEAAYHEAHAGFTYCAIGALAMLGRLPSNAGSPVSAHPLADPELTTRWLVARQTLALDEEDEEPDVAKTPAGVKLHGLPSQTTAAGDPDFLQWAGFNGRCNKIADTCYAWWVCASLSMLGKVHLVSQSTARRYLLEKTQHLVGGFGKVPGDPPDIYHSYLGLAALSLLGEPAIKPIRASACLSEHACQFLESLPWRKQITG